MHLTIDGTLHKLTDLRAFRKDFDLPDSFCIDLFEPKDYTGLGSVEQSGGMLNAVRLHMLDAVPDSITLLQLLPIIADLVTLFRTELEAINIQIGLRETEIDFAVSGFEDVMKKWAYALIHAYTAKYTPSKFEVLYNEWLNDSVRVSIREHEYLHQGMAWAIQTLTNAYGRIGMIVDTGSKVYYVHDETLACPAAGFMYNLLRDTANSVLRGLGK